MLTPSGPAPTGPSRAVAPRLRSEFADDPEMAELVRLFVSELPERLAAIAGAWRAGDSETLQRMAHQLRGAGSGYGFPAVTEAAARVESALLGGSDGSDLARIKSQVDSLLEVCRRASMPETV